MDQGKQAGDALDPALVSSVPGNEARLQLSLVAHDLGSLWRRLVMPKSIDDWSLTSSQRRLVKTGGWLIKHARYYWLLLAEGHLHRLRNRLRGNNGGASDAQKTSRRQPAVSTRTALVRNFLRGGSKER